MFLKDNEISVRAGVTQLVECDLAKVDVAGSNPVSRSKFSMTRHLLVFACAPLVFAQQYKLEPISGSPPNLPSAYTSVIDTKGYRVVGPSGPWCEIWFQKTLPTTGQPPGANIAFPIPQGALLGILRFPAQGSDRRGQNIKPGVYTMRYSDFPVDGAHQGIAPQRDFALLTPIANDPDPSARPDFDKLVAQSKTTGTTHPAVFGLETPSGSTFPALVKEGESDWALSVKVGDMAISIIVVGHVEA